MQLERKNMLSQEGYVEIKGDIRRQKREDKGAKRNKRGINLRGNEGENEVGKRKIQMCGLI